mgnify:CR=1 FL=1|tara:strand:+ start:73 stop:540 length:468 start_codon:yes stop_codon:yes gene_type:complete
MDRKYRDYRIEYDQEVQEDCKKNMYFIYAPDSLDSGHFADVSPYSAKESLLNKYIDFHIIEGWFPDRKGLRQLGMDIIGTVTEENIDQATLILIQSRDYNTLVEETDRGIEEAKNGVICIRCGGRGGSIIEPDGGYLPCFACGDSGLQGFDSFDF